MTTVVATSRSGRRIARRVTLTLLERVMLVAVMTITVVVVGKFPALWDVENAVIVVPSWAEFTIPVLKQLTPRIAVVVSVACLAYSWFAWWMMRRVITRRYGGER